MSKQRGRTPGRFIISRDVLSFMGGWYLLIYQAQFASQFNLAVFIGGMVIVGVPGAAQAFTLWTSSRIESSSEDSPEQASSSQHSG